VLPEKLCCNAEPCRSHSSSCSSSRHRWNGSL